MSLPPSVLLTSLYVLAAIGLGVNVARVRQRIAEGRWRRLDGAVRAWWKARRSVRGLALAAWLAAPGRPLVLFSIACVVAFLLRPKVDLATCLLPAVATLVAGGGHVAHKHRFQRRRPPRALASGTREPSYPSGHAAGALAFLGATAHSLDHAQIVSWAASTPLVVGLTLHAGAVQLYRERHWLSDLVGGYSLGGAVLSLALGAWTLVQGPALR